MTKVALIETKISKTNFAHEFPGIDLDVYQLCSDPSVAKVLKRNVDIKIDTDQYDWVILVGSEPFKEFTKNNSITEYTGKVVNDKFLPIINPAMLAFKPEAKKVYDSSKEEIYKYISGEKTQLVITDKMAIGIQDTKEAKKFIQAAIDHPLEYVGLDSETSSLYPRQGHMLGISLAYCADFGAYIDVDCFDEEIEIMLQYLFNVKTVVFHNAKFDISWFRYHFNFVFPQYEDTMLLHYLIDEQPGTHGLKTLVLRFTDLGDYEKEMYEWIDNYRKQHGLAKSQFSFEMIPFEVMKTYAAIDALGTFRIFEKFRKIKQNKKLARVYDHILIPGTSFLIDMENNGVPFDKERLLIAQGLMQDNIDTAIAELYKVPEVSQFEKIQGAQFNPNSTLQLRKLLFDYLGLRPTGIKTGTGADSTNAEVLKLLGEESHIPALILEIRQKSKIKNTYLDKIIPQLDRDSRLRTGFNLHTTTSGRLSSSGKLNMQQLPRDNPIVKGCIKARDGYVIVAMDLTTAEVYIAAVLSGDTALMEVFRSGGNFHNAIAHKVFNLPCSIEEVADLYPLERQAAKAISFGIMYGASADKISKEITKNSGKYCSKSQAQEYINDYFREFHKLEEWIEENQKFIRQNGFIYSFFGRKRRLPNVFSKDRGIVGHEIRSGLNFKVQSVASDINLLGAIDANQLIKARQLDARIFALVHDSILAEVRVEDAEEYIDIIKTCVQTDRGLSIPGAPVGCDIDVGQDYSMGKFEKMYGSYLS